MLLKAIATIEKFAMDLDPDMALVSVMRKHALYILNSRYGLKQLAGNLYHTIGDYFNLIRDLPSELNEILYKIKEGKLVHEIDLQDKQYFQQTLSKIGYRIGLALILGFLMIGTSIMYIWGQPDSKLDEFLFGITAILAFITGLRWMAKSG
jgi:ubiquinone biosynthesis protein